MDGMVGGKANYPLLISIEASLKSLIQLDRPHFCRKEDDLRALFI